MYMLKTIHLSNYFKLAAWWRYDSYDPSQSYFKKQNQYFAAKWYYRPDDYQKNAMIS